MLGISFGEKNLLPENLVPEGHAASFQLPDNRPHHEKIVIPGRPFITAMSLHARQKNPLFFPVRVGNAKLSAKLGPSHLEPGKVVGMINDTHLVGFTVANPKRDLPFVRLQNPRHFLCHKRLSSPNAANSGNHTMATGSSR